MFMKELQSSLLILLTHCGCVLFSRSFAFWLITSMLVALVFGVFTVSVFHPFGFIFMISFPRSPLPFQCILFIFALFLSLTHFISYSFSSSFIANIMHTRSIYGKCTIFFSLHFISFWLCVFVPFGKCCSKYSLGYTSHVSIQCEYIILILVIYISAQFLHVSNKK